MIKVLFICHGNICRSPMAEFIFKDIVKKAGKEDQFLIASCATSTEEIGNGVYPPAKRKLAEHGLSAQGKRAVQFKKSDYDKYDYILAMERRNIRNLGWLIGADPEGKIKRLLDYSDNPRDISDPWYSGDFELAYRDILEGCEALFEFIRQHDQRLYISQ
jgi:protein-tyrosine phosphatase